MTQRNEVYKCAACGNIVEILHAGSCVPQRCGEPMKELVPASTDGAYEKHVPSVSIDGNTVKVQVGEVKHPMLDEHFIQFIAAETKNGFQIKYLKPGDEPAAEFALAEGDTVTAVYEYCNLHGLWVKEL